MKRIFALLLLTCLLLGCFSACNTADPDPKDTVGSETETVSDTEPTPEEALDWLLSFKADLPSRPAPSDLEVVPKEDIPGNNLEYRLLSAGKDSQFREEKASFLSEEEAREVLESLGMDSSCVDFETELVIRVSASFSWSELGEKAVNWDHVGITQLLLSELASSDGSVPGAPCLLFIYEAPSSDVNVDVTFDYVSYLVVKKADLPQKQLQYYCLGYSTVSENCGTYAFEPMFTYLLPESKGAS